LLMRCEPYSHLPVIVLGILASALALAGASIGSVEAVEKSGQGYIYHEITASNGGEWIGWSIQMSPNGNSYTVCRGGIDSLPYDAALGDNLMLSDDGSAFVELPAGNIFPFFGISYTGLYVNANGNITFTGPDWTWSSTAQNHFNQPRISPLFVDLNPESGGAVRVHHLGNGVVVTWDRVPLYGNPSALNTLQAVLSFDGGIGFYFEEVDVIQAIIGLSDGEGVPDGLVSANPADYPGCTPGGGGGAVGGGGVAVADVISYQGLLTDDQGQNLAGEHNLTFRLYAKVDDVEDDAMWSSTLPGVLVQNGMFSVLLRDPELPDGPRLADSFALQSRFIAVTVGDPGEEIKPRQALLSTPYALVAGNVPPPGRVTPYFGESDPPGWIVCDGRMITYDLSAFGDHPDYDYNPAYRPLIEQLAAIEGYPGEREGGDTPRYIRIPDLRGYFVRGLDAGRNQDPQPGRAIGSFQQDELKSHTHPENIMTGIPGQWVNAGGLYNIQGGGPGTTGATGGPESRPKNVAVNYIIKY
jgi:hypothetical protein